MMHTWTMLLNIRAVLYARAQSVGYNSASLEDPVKSLKVGHFNCAL